MKNISDFIDYQLNIGNNSIEKIIEEAKLKIIELEKDILEKTIKLEESKEYRKLFKNIIVQFEDNVKLKENFVSSIFNFSEFSKEMQILIIKICNVLEKEFDKNLNISLRDLMNLTSFSLDEQKKYLIGIKWLRCNKIISNSEKLNSYYLIKGESWEKRPKDIMLK